MKEMKKNEKNIPSHLTEYAKRDQEWSYVRTITNAANTTVSDSISMKNGDNYHFRADIIGCP